MMKNAVNLFFLLIMFTNTLVGQNFFERVEYSTQMLPLINTAESEFSPAIVINKLFFTSVQDKESDQSFYNVYSTETDSKGYPQVLKKLVPGFGNPFHEGPVSWCETTGELFVTVSNISGGDTLRRVFKKENIRLRIVIMKKVDERWLIVEEFPFNRDEFNFAHPAINKTGDTLVFSSDMSNGFGNSDLYMSVRTEGQWSEPVNLGESVNTTGNEMFPTFGPGGLLLFSSDGFLEGLGQMDIYYTNLSGDSPVINLGDKINSEYDDFGLVVHSSGDYGYFSSNRPGKGSDDIYRVEFISLYQNIGGVVINSKGAPVAGAAVTLQDCNGTDLQSALSGENGRFRFEVLKEGCYQAVAAKSGYLSDLKPFHLDETITLIITQVIRYRIYVLDIESEEPLTNAEVYCNDKQWLTNGNGYAEIDADSIGNCNLRVTGKEHFNYIIEVDPYRLVPGVDIVDTVRLFKKELNHSYVLKDIRFFLDKWRLLPESELELQKLIKLMEDNPSLKIELASHTDSRGKAPYNQWLSQKRAESAADFLIENGITKDRIVSKGYGESRLLNHCANGVPCTEEEHLVNRRTEFKVLDY